MSSERSYTLKARAERQAETRRRIAAATADLHASVGPARTTIAEIARRAGVQRPTVYNNFPDERELFAACQAHFIEGHPLPDFAEAFSSPDPLERVRRALAAFYGWYRDTEAMSANVARDRGVVPELDALLADTADARRAELADALAAGLAGRSSRARLRVRATLRIAFEFSTWQRLTSEGLSDAEAADAMAQAARAVATSGRRA